MADTEFKRLDPHTVKFDPKAKVPKKYSRSERETVAHYIFHGDQKCARCLKGFDYYWNKGVR